VSDALLLSDFDFELADHSPEFLTWPFPVFRDELSQSFFQRPNAIANRIICHSGLLPQAAGPEPVRKAPTRLPRGIPERKWDRVTRDSTTVIPLYTNG
jgi:hypothetical protein